ncbi:MAG: hypothetical protein LQ338_001234 [Usnochroma carphineum]|nr:MAG: hypothetical protein LQ338_001234 [Usnochroma carphineum]
MSQSRDDVNRLSASVAHVEKTETAGVNNERSEGELYGNEPTDEEGFDSEGYADESSGYESPPSPTPCECGYVSYDSDYGSSENEYSSEDDDYYYGGRRSVLEDGRLSRSYRHHVTCEAKDPFSFEKLPPEIRSMIFRFLMPDDRTRPLHSREYDWNDKYDCYFTEDFVERVASAAAIPTSLFRVNKAVSAEALRLLHNETFFRMDITPFGVYGRGGSTKYLSSFTNHKVLAKWKAFKCMRNYHLNLKSSSIRETFHPRAEDIYRDPRTYEDGAERIKEWLRLICDELVANGIIQNLTITAPCKCAQKAARRVPKDERTMVDLFSPLKRISLPNSVSISLHDDRKKRKGIQDSCRKAECLGLAQTLQASIGRLQGEPLSEREATWKEIKSLKQRDESMMKNGARMNGYDWRDWADSGIEHVWACLNGRRSEWYFDDMQHTFEDYVQNFHTQRAKAEVKRLARKKEYDEEQEAKRQAELKNDSLGGEQHKPQMSNGTVRDVETSQQQTAKHYDHQQKSRDDASAK